MVYLFLTDGFEEIEAITIIDILRRANIEITSISISNNLNVIGSHNICIKADKIINNIEFNNIEAIILPGGPGTPNLGNCCELKDLLLKANNENKFIMAICAAPSILGKYGILENKKATCYPGFEDKLIGAKISYDDVIVDENIVTSRGPGTATIFSLKIVEILKGKDKYNEVKNNMIII